MERVEPVLWLHLAQPVAYGDLVLGGSPHDLVSAIIGESYAPHLARVALEKIRAEWLIAYAEVRQAALIEEAQYLGSFSWAALSDRERTRLKADKRSTDPFPEDQWRGQVPLILVDPGDGRETPDGVIRLSAGSPIGFLIGLRNDGFVKSIGWLAGRDARDPGHGPWP